MYLEEISHLIKTLKSYFHDAYYYEIDALLLVNESNKLKKICEIVAPTIYQEETPITFYYPYINKLGNSKEAKATIVFENNEEKSFDSFLSLHTRETDLQSTGMMLKLKIQDSDGGFHTQAIGMNNYIYENISYSKNIEASFYNAIKAQEYSDLSFNAFPITSKYKTRFSIIFREKLSALNAQIMGVSTIVSLLCVCLFLSYMIADLHVYRIKGHEDFKFRLILAVFVFSAINAILLFIFHLFIDSLEWIYLWPAFLLFLSTLIFFGIYCFNSKTVLKEEDPILTIAIFNSKLIEIKEEISKINK